MSCSGRAARGVEVEVEGSERVRAILSCENQPQGIAVEGLGEGDDRVGEMFVDVG